MKVIQLKDVDVKVHSSLIGHVVRKGGFRYKVYSAAPGRIQLISEAGLDTLKDLSGYEYHEADNSYRGNFPIEEATAVCAIIRKGYRVLMISNRSDKPENLKWGFPGGKIEPGETAEQAIIREVKEETGLTVIRAIPVYGGICNGFKSVGFIVDTEGSTLDRDPNNDDGWLEWFDYIDLKYAWDNRYRAFNQNFMDMVVWK